MNAYRFLCLLITLLYGLPQSALSQGMELQPFDLLFVSPAESNAITKVTSGYNSEKIDHVAVFIGEAMVIEAVPDGGVHLIAVDSFLRYHATDNIYIGRVTSSLDSIYTREKLMSCIGLPYDSLYLPDNDAVYCSELVTDCFVDSSGEQLFATIPMTFRDSNGSIPEYWIELYQRHQLPVPEGEPGSNPAELSRRGNVMILRKIRIF